MVFKFLHYIMLYYVANCGHNETTVNAYYHALALSPGFIRARYNLGISSSNLNAYKHM